MNILLINYRYFLSGGPERYMFGVEKLLQDAGHKVVPFSFGYAQNKPTPYSKHFARPPMGSDSVLYKEARLSPLTKLKVLGKSLYNFEAARKLRKVIEEENIDVAYVLQAVNTLYPAIVDVCNDMNIPVVYRLSDFQFVCANYKLFRDNKICEDCVGGSYYRGLIHRCLKGSLAVSAARVASMYLDRLRGTRDKVELYVTPSRIVRDKMIEGGFEPWRVMHLSSFIDTREMAPRFEPGDYVLYAGAIEPFKGVRTLIEAFAKLPKHARLVIAGYSLGDEEALLKEEVARRNLTNITFQGFQAGDAYAELVRHARFVVAPTLWYENIPNAVLEAMAYGKPVVGSDLGGVAEIITHESDGLIVPPGDVDALADAMLSLIDDPARIEMLGKAARHKMDTVYAPKQHLDKLEAIFQIVTGQASEDQLATNPVASIGKADMP